jgi:uncharacterized membrane protein YfcA
MVLLWVGLAALAAGVINAIAGGGTFLTFPVLTGLARLSEKGANVTSTVGLWPGNASAMAGAWPELRKVGATVIVGYAVVGCIGGIVGAVLLLWTGERAFAKAVPWLLGFSTVMFALGKRIGRWAGRHVDESAPLRPRFTPRVVPLLLVISVYVGYFGAGAGVLLLAGLSIAGLHDLRQMNALKTVIQATGNLAAVVVFAWGGVDWRLAGVMAGASLVGGYAGMWTAQRVPQVWVRAVVLTIGVVLTGVYFVKAYG